MRSDDGWTSAREDEPRVLYKHEKGARAVCVCVCVCRVCVCCVHMHTTLLARHDDPTHAADAPPLRAARPEPCTHTHAGTRVHSIRFECEVPAPVSHVAAFACEFDLHQVWNACVPAF